MQQAIFMSVLTDIAVALIALATLWAMMRLRDHAVMRGENRGPNSVIGRWARRVNQIQEQPLPAAIYYAASWVGACLLLGMLFR